MTYEIDYLYQTSDDGRDWANGAGPLQHNLRIVSAHQSKEEALRAGAKLIGSPSPMGVIADAYLIRRSSRSSTVLGAIRQNGTLDRGFSRPPVQHD